MEGKAAPANYGVDTPYTPRWNNSKRLGQAQGIRDPKYTVYMEGKAAPANCGVDTPYTPLWNHSKQSVLRLGQSRGIRDTRYTVYMEGEAAPALSLLGPQKSPMREYPGGCPGGRVPKKGTQPTQKGRPKKDRIPAPKRGARVPLTQPTQKGRPQKDRIPQCPGWCPGGRKTPQCQPTQKGRPQKDRIPFPKIGMWEYPGARMTPGAGWPHKDRIPIPKRGMWESPGERNTPGGKTPGEKDRTPIDRVGNPIGTKKGIAKKGRAQKEWVLPIGAKSFKEPQSWVTQRVGTPQELAHRGTHLGRPPDLCRNSKLGK